MKTILTTKYDIIFNSDLVEVLGFTNKKYNAGTHLSEKVLDKNSVDKVLLKCNCVDGSIVEGKRESILFSFSLDASRDIKFLKNPLVFCLKK